jgi:hypothetical protein
LRQKSTHETRVLFVVGTKTFNKVFRLLPKYLNVLSDDGSSGGRNGEKNDGRNGEKSGGRNGEKNDGQSGEKSDDRNGEKSDGRNGEKNDGLSGRGPEAGREGLGIRTHLTLILQPLELLLEFPMQNIYSLKTPPIRFEHERSFESFIALSYVGRSYDDLGRS